jgi:hypothetical protein
MVFKSFFFTRWLHDGFQHEEREEIRSGLQEFAYSNVALFFESFPLLHMFQELLCLTL